MWYSPAWRTKQWVCTWHFSCGNMEKWHLGLTFLLSFWLMPLLLPAQNIAYKSQDQLVFGIKKARSSGKEWQDCLEMCLIWSFLWFVYISFIRHSRTLSLFPISLRRLLALASLRSFSACCRPLHDKWVPFICLTMFMCCGRVWIQQLSLVCKATFTPGSNIRLRWFGHKLSVETAVDTW